jgi:hypothetical protein
MVDAKFDLSGKLVEEIFYDLGYFYHQDDTQLHTPISYSVGTD